MKESEHRYNSALLEFGMAEKEYIKEPTRQKKFELELAREKYEKMRRKLPGKRPNYGVFIKEPGSDDPKE